MLDYTTYKAIDFLQDENFILYCNHNIDAIAFWEKVLVQEPQLQKEIDEAKILYAALSIRISPLEKSEALATLKKTIEIEKQQAGKATLLPVTFINKKLRWVIMAAAAIAGVLLISSIWFNKIESYSINDTPVAVFAKVLYNTAIKSGENERKVVTLPDGSIVTMNYGSTLKLATDYNQTHRWVYLEGEVFFSVKPDKQRPFVVITSKNATSALGTSFKVRNYPGENNSDIMLATGKVKVQSMLNQSAKGDLILLPGDKASCLNKDLPVKSAFDLEVLRNWRSLKINLNKANLENIIDTLGFYYGVQVKLINKPGKEIAFTGKFDNESLQNVLEAISFTNKFSYTQKGNNISVLFQ